MISSKIQRILTGVAGLFFSGCAFYWAWTIFNNPNYPVHKIEKTMVAHFGLNGLMFVWIILGCACLWYAYAAFFSKSKAWDE